MKIKMKSNIDKSFSVGDRVKVITDVPMFIGKTGTVVGYKDNTTSFVIVELDESYRYVHNLKTGKSYLSGTRLYLESAIEKLEV